MKRTIPWLIVAILLVFGSIAQQQQKPPDPVLTFKLTLPQISSIIYSIRNSTILDAKTANELADLLVAQANDTTLNKPLTQAPKQK